MNGRANGDYLVERSSRAGVAGAASRVLTQSSRSRSIGSILTTNAVHVTSLFLSSPPFRVLTQYCTHTLCPCRQKTSGADRFKYCNYYALLSIRSRNESVESCHNT